MQPIAALAGPLEMFLTSTVDRVEARACMRAQGVVVVVGRAGGGGRFSASPKLQTAQLRLGKISQLLIVRIEHLFRAGP